VVRRDVGTPKHKQPNASSAQGGAAQKPGPPRQDAAQKTVWVKLLSEYDPTDGASNDCRFLLTGAQTVRAVTIRSIRVLHTLMQYLGEFVRQISAARAILYRVLEAAVRACAPGHRRRSKLSTSHSAWHDSFAQAPQPALLADALSLEIVAANAELQRCLAMSEAQITSINLTQLFSPDGDSNAIAEGLRNPDPDVPLRIRRSMAGQHIAIELKGYRVDSGRRSLLVYSAIDVTSRSKIEEALLENQNRLAHLAHHDQLTGLPNRLFLAANLPAAISTAKQDGKMLGILFLDLDRFKHINDSRGHETGDALLKAVALRIRSTIRGDDVVVRMGGDEFIVLLYDIPNVDRVTETAERLIDAVSSPVNIQGHVLSTTVSIGVSVYPRDGADMGELLRHSDTAMYQAKELGRNNCQVFSVAMDRRLRQKIAVESHLRAALKKKQFEVHYQPIVDIQSRRVVAMEALLRWKHPDYGFVPPGRFIALAEETGLILPIGDFVLQRVVEDMARWRDGNCDLVPIAVNVSAVQLQRGDVPGLIAKLTSAKGLDSDLLHVELTESAIFERRSSREGHSNQDAVDQLRERGIKIAIDDFGTGYSSLAYLKHWRFDFLKIDRTFVRDLVTDPSDLAIVGAIVAMARHLQIQVIAEGIEGWQQLEKLRELGCSLAQGHLLAKPTPAAACARFLSGAPLDLLGRDRTTDALDATGIGPNSIADLLEGTSRASTG
jgi:diguanylate cyclase (GGDEF)-like protein